MACHRIRSDYSLSDLFQSLRSFSVFFDLSLFHRVVLKHFDNSCILRTKRMKLISQKIREIEESPKVLLVKGFLWKVFIERIRSTCIESNRIECTCTESPFQFRFRCWLRPFGKVSERRLNWRRLSKMLDNGRTDDSQCTIPTKIFHPSMRSSLHSSTRKFHRMSLWLKGFETLKLRVCSMRIKESTQCESWMRVYPVSLSVSLLNECTFPLDSNEVISLIQFD